VRLKSLEALRRPGFFASYPGDFVTADAFVARFSAPVVISASS